MKYKFKLFFKKLPSEVLQAFGIIMTVFAVGKYISGFRGDISVYMIFQLLGVAIIGGALMLISFSDIFIKKLHPIIRCVIFIIPLILTTLLFALAFSWFPVDSLEGWAIFATVFLSCFIGCFIIFLIIHFIECSIKGKKYTEKLKEYQNKNHDDVSIY